MRKAGCWSGQFIEIYAQAKDLGVGEEKLMQIWTNKEVIKMVVKIIKFVNVILFFLLILTPFSSSGESGKAQLNLDQLIEEALQNNPEILAAKKRWEVFKEKPSQASALEDPMLGLGIVSLPTNFSFKDEDKTTKEISISQKFPFPGKRPLMREMAEKEAEAVSSEIEEKSNRIVKEVKTVYYDLAYVHQSIEITQRNKEILESFVKIAETQYSLGMGIQQDVLKAHVEVSKMVDGLIMLGRRKKALEAKLNSILNRPLETALRRPEELSVRKLPFAYEELHRMAVELNPTLKGMKKMVEAKEKAHALAKREYYPDLNVRFAYGQRDNGPEMKRRDMLTGMVEMNIPIFYKSKQDRKVAGTVAHLKTQKRQ